MTSDAERTATALIAECGTLPELLKAEPGRLASLGVTQASLHAIAALSRVAARLAETKLAEPLYLTSFHKVVAYLRDTIGLEECEQVVVLYFAASNRLIKAERLACGTVDQCPIYPREVIKRALHLNAVALVLAHNHPSGRAEPSKADIQVTREVANAGRALGIVVHDHLVLAREECASLRALNLL